METARISFRAGLVVLAFVASTLPVAGARADVAPPQHVVDGSASDWRDDVATMVPGTAAYGHHEWAFTDYVYDDRGAGGSFTYPEGHGNNAADIAVLQIAADTDAVRYLVRLNTLLEPDQTVVTLAVDTDCDESTGGGPWPFGAAVTTAGWEHVVTSWGTGAAVTTSTGETIEVASGADTVENLIEFEVPHAIADPGTGSWCYRGGSGVWDDGSWLEMDSASTPNIFNLLFRNRAFDGGTAETDENSSGGLQFARQSAALSAGNLGPFVRRVDFGVLTSGEVVGPPAVTTDHNFTRIYATAGFPNTLPEGVSQASNAVGGSLYNGRYHPYILFVPASYWEGLPDPAPMFPMLHGWTQDHRGYNPSDNAFWNDVVRANRALVAKPFGRGQEVWYEHVGELDILEVIADVARHYVVDPDRVYIGGVSMGGLGTIKLATSHPDLFAGMFPSVPAMSDRAQGYALPENNDWDLVDVASSLRNVPARVFMGTYDPLVPAGIDPDRLCDRLRSLAYDHDCWRDISAGGTHRGYDNDRAAELALLLSEHRRVIDPAHVTYSAHPAFRRQAEESGLGSLLRYDRAYWVQNIRWPQPPVDESLVPQDGPLCGESGCIDARRWPSDPGLVRRLAEGERISTVDVRTFGRGDGDPEVIEVGPSGSPTLIRSGLVVRPGPPVEPRNAFTLSSTDVVGFDLDLGRMGLTLDTPLSGEVSGAGSLELGLIGAADTCTATVDGEPVPVEREGDRLVVSLDLDEDVRSLMVACG